MADYAGAVEAIKAHFAASWATTRVVYDNETPADPWPPKDGAGRLAAWVRLEVICTGARLAAVGTPGAAAWRYDGEIIAHVFVPVAGGLATARAHAVAIGEVFRNRQLYDGVTAGAYVRTGIGVDGSGPSVDRGGAGDDDGVWFRVSAAIPFQYWHRG